MLKSEITFERILGTFVPGAIFVVGSWYFLRPFLLKYFPYVAGDPVGPDAVLGKEIKIILFIIGAFSLGLIFNHFSDIFIVALFRDESLTGKSLRRSRLLFRHVMRLTGNSFNTDPRTRAVNRYLGSQRKERFLRMMSHWAGTDEKLLEEPGEKVIAHQHIIFRLRVLSEESRKLLYEAWFPVVFSSSIVCSLASLVPVSLVALLTSTFLSKGFKQYLGIPVILLYLAVILSTYSLKRQFRHFCQYSLTLAMHFHEISSERDKVNLLPSSSNIVADNKMTAEKDEKINKLDVEVA